MMRKFVTAEDAPLDISHSDTDSDGIWEITWTAPPEDLGPVHFGLLVTLSTGTELQGTKTGGIS